VGIWRYYFLIVLLVPILFSISINDAFAEITISDDVTGGDCSTIGTWDSASRTCTFTSNVSETVVVGSNNITLDGNGYAIDFGATSYEEACQNPTFGKAIDLSVKTNIVIKNFNIQNSCEGIVFSNSVSSSILNNIFTNNYGYRIYVSQSTGTVISGNTMSSSATLQYGTGIFHDTTDQSSAPVIENNNISNTQKAILVKNYPTIKNNNLDNNWAGIDSRDQSLIFNNVVTNSGDTGIGFGASSQVYHNTVSNSGRGFVTTGCCSEVFENTLSNNGNGLSTSDYNNIFHNNFLNNDVEATGGGSIFENQERSSGNFWSDYSPICVDDNNDNFCDDPYPFSGGTIGVHDSHVWTIQDGWLTTINTPGDITIEATDSTGSIVDFSVSATFDGNPTSVTCDSSSGSIFPIGETIVLCTASTGIVSTFAVTVQDTIPPAVVVEQGITVETTNSSGEVVTFQASATDNVDGEVTPSCQPASGSTFSIGETEVTCTATDSSGNVGTSSFSITLIDISEPELTIFENPHLVDAFGNSITSVNINQQVQIVADMTNTMSTEQKFIYLVLIEDSINTPVSLAWVSGSLSPEQSFSPAVSWTPASSQKYTITIQFLESISNPQLLAPPLTLVIDIGGSPITEIGPEPPFQPDLNQQPASSLTISTNKQLYDIGEIIVVSGKIPDLGEQNGIGVTLKVTDPVGNVVFLKSTIPDSDWSYEFQFRADGTVKQVGQHEAVVQFGIINEVTYFDFILESPPIPQPELKIPQEFKQVAKDWSNGSISDFEFLQQIQIRINDGSMVIPGVDTGGSGGSTASIPAWVKNNAGWWADGQIADSDFASGIEYLFTQGFLPVTISEEPTPEPEPEPEPVPEPEPPIDPRCGSGTVYDPATNSCVLEEQPQPTPEPEFEIFSLRTTQNTYRVGDTIFITGKATLGDLKTPITLQIIKDGQVVDSAQLSLRLDGTFSHTVLAEGPQWSESGKYLVKATFGGDVEQTRFIFSAIEAPPERSEPSPDHVLVSATPGSSVPGCEDTNECFIPSEARVSVGGTVTWSNDDTAAHTVTSGSAVDGPDGNFDSSLFMAGTTFRHTFDTVGTFPYFCMVHPWMQGVVIVGQGGTSSTPPPRHEPVDLEVSTDQRIYDLGDLVQVGVTLDGTTKTHQVAIDVADPTGTTIITRTVSVSPDSIEQIQFRISDNFKTGSYTVAATTLVDGKTIKDKTFFKVKSQFNQFRIVSVEVTDQQGHPSTLQRGDIGFIKVLLDSNKQITTLITINLFDSDLTSIGIGSVKSTLTSGTSEIIISFLIPDFTALGDLEIFVNAFSDWPSNGGIPLTNEFSIIAKLGNGNQPPPSPPPQPTSISVNVSDSLVEEGDTIVISGRVTTIILETPVTIQIFNGGNLIEIAQLVVAQDGTFTHTIIAQGPQWQNEGDYTVRATYGEGNTAEANFEFFKKTVGAGTSDFFEVDAGNSGTFDVEYIIRGGTVKNMIVDSEMFALIVTIESTGDGSLTLELPRESIDAIKSDGSDDVFIVLIDGIEVSYDEAITNENTRTLTITFQEGDSDIEIFGTFIVGSSSSSGIGEQACPDCGPSTTQEKTTLLTVQTDYDFYEQGDTIAVLGKANPEKITSQPYKGVPETIESKMSVSITIITSTGNIAAISQVVPDDDGTYLEFFQTTGSIWKYPGIYTVKVQQGTESVKTEFWFIYDGR